MKAISKDITKVSFRRFKDTGDIIALFPEIPHDIQGNFCVSYMRVGQHSAADPCLSGVSKPASIQDEDVKALFVELTVIGYDLKPIKKVSFKMHQTRRNNALKSLN